MRRLCNEMKALCMPDAICNVIVWSMGGARGPEDPDKFVMISTTTTRVQALRETATRPLRLPTVEGSGGVDQLPTRGSGDTRGVGLTARRGTRTASF
ncbi:hypothetical protein PoB_004736600 [Plakobranchus ocellatus]|uniref:Uncharacterized protein n=1 Tax=Plakobranchus ocellatus TaxID=259542 RepID=A0AAV4BBX6_9GAST|nr:hypothetical protein PoB_004736600 [Plakobranchus ocellatus]